MQCSSNVVFDCQIDPVRCLVVPLDSIRAFTAQLRRQCRSGIVICLERRLLGSNQRMASLPTYSLLWWSDDSDSYPSLRRPRLTDCYKLPHAKHLYA
jgi:hypothetical protein